VIEKHAWKRGLTPLDKGGATQQISDTPIADSESVEELAEEGNAFEANAIYGVENARDPDVAEVITHEIPEDDVPSEYLDNDEHLA
jgi:N utilization substance protein A